MDRILDPHELVVSRARALIGQATYLRLAQSSQAPAVVNCLTLVVWAYRPTGLNLPETLALIDLGEEVPLEDLAIGDLVFTAGWQAYLNHVRYGEIGHVGIATGEGTVVHATRRVRQARSGVYEDSLEDFIAGDSFRVARQLLTPESRLLSRVS